MRANTAPVTVPLAVVQFCAEECARQESGELSVANMINAWCFLRIPGSITTEDIVSAVQIIEPKKNQPGYRKQPVTVRGKVIPVRNFERALLMALEYLDPEGFYREFEELHPFNDGNGRVGALLYNALKGSMENPVAPPDYWKEELE